MSAPKVCAIVPVHDGAAFLDQALRSVAEQDYPALEIIVVDDGSGDDSAEIARRHRGVRVIQQENQGVAVARNTGITASDAELLAFLDQDDLWMPGKLEAQVRRLLIDPGLGYVLGQQILMLEPGTAPPPWIAAALFERHHVGYFPGTLVARRWAFECVGLFAPAAPPAEGADWFARANDAGVAMAIVPEVVLAKRIHAHNQSRDLHDVQGAVLRALRRSIDRKRAKGAS